MKKEKPSRHINIVVQPSLFDLLETKCNKRYKTVSEVIRELIVKYVEEGE